jgi:hypothetical protein
MEVALPDIENQVPITAAISPNQYEYLMSRVRLSAAFKGGMTIW